MISIIICMILVGAAGGHWQLGGGTCPQAHPRNYAPAPWLSQILHIISNDQQLKVVHLLSSFSDNRPPTINLSFRVLILLSRPAAFYQINFNSFWEKCHLSRFLKPS